MTSAAYLASIRADGLRLLTWAPREPEALPEGVRRLVARWESVERRAREAEPTDLVALITAEAAIRHLLRERVA